MKLHIPGGTAYYLLRLMCAFAVAILLRASAVAQEAEEPIRLWMEVCDETTSIGMKEVKVTVMDTVGTVMCDASSMLHFVNDPQPGRLFETVEYLTMRSFARHPKYRVTA